MKLNDKQRAAVDYMHDFMKGNERMMVLEGYAGTGKTTCVQTFAQETPHSVVFTAPTNKATKVLRSMADAAGNGTECSTIYSLLGLILQSNGEIRHVDAVGENKAEQFDVIVVDEGSMVGENLFKHISDAATHCRVKIIFMGDPAQLPPVNEANSKVFQLPNKVTLTEVMRHDNQILRLATHIRECISSGSRLELSADNDENGGVFIANNGRFRNQLEKGFTSDSYADNPDAFKTVAWRNVTVKAHNDYIRACMYGDDVPETFQIGERVVACSPVVDLSSIGSGQIEISLHTDEEANVVAIDKQNHPIFKNIVCDKVMFEGDYIDSEAYVVAEESKSEHKEMMDRLASRAKSGKGSWSAFWEAKDCFHDLRPCHAITAHRSQGSTYDTVFVNAADILLNRDEIEALKCLYVAVGRASRIVVLKTK